MTTKPLPRSTEVAHVASPCALTALPSVTTVSASHQVRSKVDGIRADARAVAECLLVVVGTIKEISNSQITIASAVEEQSVTTKDLNIALGKAVQLSRDMAEKVDGFAAATDEVALGISQTSATSASLAGLSGEVRTLLASFKTSENQVPALTQDNKAPIVARPVKLVRAS